MKKKLLFIMVILLATFSLFGCSKSPLKDFEGNYKMTSLYFPAEGTNVSVEGNSNAYGELTLTEKDIRLSYYMLGMDMTSTGELKEVEKTDDGRIVYEAGESSVFSIKFYLIIDPNNTNEVGIATSQYTSGEWSAWDAGNWYCIYTRY